MKKIQKLKLNKTISQFEPLNKEDLGFLFGGGGTAGNSCNNTGSSCGCDNTSNCNCYIKKSK